MTKKVITITKNDIKQMVLECIAKLHESGKTPFMYEAYSTPSVRQREDFENLNNLGVFSEMYNTLEKLYNIVNRDTDDGINYRSSERNKYEKAIMALCDKIAHILKLWQNQEIQQTTGLQPDSLYDISHQSPTSKQKRVN